jgi:hypothetical protein
MRPHFVDDPNAAIRRDVGDDLPHRVRADVDGGDALGPRLAVSSIRARLRGDVEGLGGGVRRQASGSGLRSGA